MPQSLLPTLDRLRQQLFLPGKTLDQPHVRFWLAASLLFAAGFAAMGVLEAFQAPYTVQDDARQHVFWMQRFLNPDFFPNDPIANYFQSVAPRGYSALYRCLALLGLSPILASKLLPPLLFLLNAALMFGVCLQVFPIPAAAFAVSLLLGQALSVTDAVFSGTPKAFVYACGLSVLYFLMRRWLLPFWLAISLQGLFYPHLVLVFAGMFALRLVEWRDRGWRWCQSRQTWLFCASGCVVAVLIMLPFVLAPNPFGPTVTGAEARSMPEFLAGGRAQFFYDDDPLRFWLHGRGGLRTSSILTPVTNVLALLLPIVLCFPRQFPLLKALSPQASWLPRLILSSLAWFSIAHLCLFALHLPSRFTEHSLRMVVTLCAGISLAVIVDGALRGVSHPARSWWAGGRSLLLALLAFAMTALLLLYPAFTPGFPFPRYAVGRQPELYEFFLSQPPDITIASLDEEGSFIATFAHRSVLVDREFSIPYHLGYYRQVMQRASDAIAAQYSLAPDKLLETIATYNIDYWLLGANAFQPDAVQGNRWLQQFQPAAQEAVANLRSRTPTALATTIDACTAFATSTHVVLDASCVAGELIERAR